MERCYPSLSANFTINKYLRKGKRFKSIYIMIQMELLKGQSLEKYLHFRNRSDDVGFWDAKTQQGLIDRM